MQLKQYVYNLYYEELEQGDHYIVFRKNKGMLIADDLTSLQVHVLQSNRIPNLLPFEKHELNGEITLLYRCSDLQVLSHVLQTMTFQMNDYYQLLLNIINVVEQSELYMLDDKRFLLHEHLIFVNQGMDDVYLCYLPVKSVAEHDTMASLLEQFSLKLLPYIEGIEEGGFKQWIRSIRDPEMSLSSVRHCLISLLDSEPGPVANEHNNEKNSEKNSEKNRWYSKLMNTYEKILALPKMKERSVPKIENDDAMKDPEQYYRELPQHTTILKRRPPEGVHAFLQVEGLTERIVLDDRSYTLGRDNAECTHMMDMIGVSRSHCEILKVDHAWFVKDLGSSNGSKLNDVALVPYSLNKLHDGDEITVVKNKFIFQQWATSS